MRVQIDEARHDDQSSGVDDVAIGAKLAADVGDRAVFDQQIDFRIEALARIDHTAVLDEETHTPN
jgi:hypothetical protein